MKSSRLHFEDVRISDRNGDALLVGEEYPRDAVVDTVIHWPWSCVYCGSDNVYDRVCETCGADHQSAAMEARDE